MLKINNLVKSYDGVNVVNDISFELKDREILCILGPNGAGKSTTINMLTSILKKDSGYIYFEERLISENVKGYKKQLGVVPQDIALYEDLSAMENIEFFASLYNVKKKDLKNLCLKALKLVDLEKRKDDKVRTFSGGMKRRLNIACAIVHNPKIVIMDEPTVGIDPQSRNSILETIIKLKDHGMSIIYTTHYMEEVEVIASRIIIMDHGDIIASGTLESLSSNIKDQREYKIVIKDNKDLDINDLIKIEGVKSVSNNEDHLIFQCLNSIENLDLIIEKLIQQHIKIISINESQTNLETVFLNLTGKTLRD